MDKGSGETKEEKTTLISTSHKRISTFDKWRKSDNYQLKSEKS